MEMFDRHFAALGDLRPPSAPRPPFAPRPPAPSDRGEAETIAAIPRWRVLGERQERSVTPARISSGLMMKALPRCPAIRDAGDRSLPLL